MNKTEIIELLKGHNSEDVKKFANYSMRIKIEKDKNKILKNPWVQNKTSQDMADLFLRVNKEGLVFDGVHVTLQKTGISYDYVAYKNKMLLAYPETIMDINLVYEGDTFSFKKDSGKITYTHEYNNPFGQLDEGIKGGYCIIKNSRGEFITLLSRADFEKHKQVAKTAYIWNQWYKEMCTKTLVKKAVKVHYEDIFDNMNEEDNKSIDLELLKIPTEEVINKKLEGFESTEGASKEISK